MFKDLKRKLNFSPAFKVMSGLVMIMISALVISQALGLIPDKRESVLESRKTLAESVAVQTSILSSLDNQDLIDTSIEQTLKRDEAVQSVALRMISGDIDVQVGDHDTHWVIESSDASSPENIRVPVLRNGELWAHVELAFKPLHTGSWFVPPFTSFVALTLLCGLICAIGFWLYIKRIIKALNPSEAIPAEVRAAYDSLSEGVLILNSYNEIVLANSALCDVLSTRPDNLYGELADDLPWDFGEKAKSPWEICTATKEPLRGARLKVARKDMEPADLLCNATPVTDDADGVKGVIVTFDDVSEITRITSEARQTAATLKETKVALEDQAEVNDTLSSEDNLTGALNRSVFFEKLDALLKQPDEGGSVRSLLIMDIDNFKSVNETYGYDLGDQILKYIVEKTSKTVSKDIEIGRLEGDAFGILIPNRKPESAKKLAETIRLAINHGEPDPSHASLKVTVSVGICTLQPNHRLETALRDADKALDMSKEQGRNKVV